MNGFEFVINESIDRVDGGIRTLMSFGFPKKDIQKLIDVIFEDIERRKKCSQE